MEAYNPLETCPKALRYRYEKTAARAQAGERQKAILLKCLECCCWEQAEVKRCEIRGCPLWRFSRANPEVVS